MNVSGSDRPQMTQSNHTGDKLLEGWMRPLKQ